MLGLSQVIEMNNQKTNTSLKSIERKKFFVKISKGFAGLVLLSWLPFKLFLKNEKKVKIEINPSAISRKKEKHNG